MSEAARDVLIDRLGALENELQKYSKELNVVRATFWDRGNEHGAMAVDSARHGISRALQDLRRSRTQAPSAEQTTGSPPYQGSLPPDQLVEAVRLMELIDNPKFGSGAEMERFTPYLDPARKRYAELRGKSSTRASMISKAEALARYLGQDASGIEAAVDEALERRHGIRRQGAQET